MLTTKSRSPGFTLMELLIVLGIIAALLVLLLPTIFSQYKRFQIRQVEITIRNLEATLEEYRVTHRRHPTNEEGLLALIFIPDNAAGTSLQPGTAPGQMMETNPMMGGSGTIGPGMFNQPGVMPGTLGPGTVGPGAVGQSMMPGTMMPGTMESGSSGMWPGASNPTNPSASPMPNPAMMPNGSAWPGGMASGGMVPGGMAATWTQPFANENLYTQRRQRSAPYVRRESDLLDPWGNVYRFDSSMTWLGVNQFTGEDRPAIWSAGPDRQDHTDDDIRNWIPEEAVQLRAERQRQMQMQYGTGTTMQPNMMQPNMMPPDGMQPGGMPGTAMPMQPGGMPGTAMPMQPGGMPGTAMPMQPGGMPGVTMPMQPGGMP